MIKKWLSWGCDHCKIELLSCCPHPPRTPQALRAQNTPNIQKEFPGPPLFATLFGLLLDVLGRFSFRGCLCGPCGANEIANVQAVLIGNPRTRHTDLVEVILKRLVGYLTAQSWVLVSYNVRRSALAKACVITPGKQAPAVMPLEVRMGGSYQSQTSRHLKRRHP